MAFRVAQLFAIWEYLPRLNPSDRRLLEEIKLSTTQLQASFQALSDKVDGLKKDMTQFLTDVLGQLTKASIKK